MTEEQRKLVEKWSGKKLEEPVKPQKLDEPIIFELDEDEIVDKIMDII